MRLIDADKIGLTDFEIVMCNGDYKEALKMLLDKISNQPTSYDLDKVVEELEERTDFLKDCTKYGNKNAEQQAESYSTMMMYEVADLVDDLIEIVKQGGSSDDVCEWTQSGDMAISPHTFSKYKIKQLDGLYALNICPHCRKKIKIVGD